MTPHPAGTRVKETDMETGEIVVTVILVGALAIIAFFGWTIGRP